VIERVVVGEMPEAEFSTLVDEIRRTLGDIGMVGTLGRSVTWTSARAGGGRNLQISITVRAGRTRVHIQESLTDLKGGLWGGMMGGLGGGGLGPIVAISVEALKVPMVLVAAIPLWLLAVFSGTRSLYHNLVASRNRTLEALADRLAALARQLAPASLPRAPERGRLP
jgi:hypothetical protein